MRKLRPPEPKYFSKIISQVKANKLQTFTTLVVVAALVAGGAFLAHVLNPNHKLERKLDSLNKTTVTCKQIIDQVGGIKDYSRYGTDLQERLLERQTLCYSDQLKFDKAIASAQKLQNLYVADNKKSDAQRVQSQIKDMQDTQAALKELHR